MSSHRGRRRASRRSIFSWLKSARVRAVLSLGLVLGFGSVSTFAYWTDQATVSGATFTSGTLNMKVDGDEGNPTPYDWSFSATNMIPGESFAKRLQVQNAGSVAFTYTATAIAIQDPSTPSALLPAMTFTAYVGGTETNKTVGDLRTGSCEGTSMGTKTLTGSAQDVIATAQNVAAAGNQDVCVVAALALSAPNNAQNQSVTASYVFNAKQIGAP